MDDAARTIDRDAEGDTAEVAEKALATEGARQQTRLGVLFWAPVVWLLLVMLLAVSAPWLGIPAPDAIDWRNIKQPPSAEHWLGTDVLGRDLLARVIYGARVSLTVGFAAPLLGISIGLLLGILAGYYQGWTDEIIGIAIDTWLAVPGLIVLLLFSVIFGGSLMMVSLSLGLLFIPSAARITRAATLNYSTREFVLAARAAGARDARILAVEIFPNIVWPLAAFMLIDIPIAIVVEGALSFLGLSVKAPTPSWGGAIAEGREHLEDAPHIALIPTAVMFLTVLSFNLVGDVLRTRFADVRQSAI